MIDDCTNTARIAIVSGNGGGGILGRGYGNSKTFEVNRSCNRGEITVDGDAVSNRANGAGGIVGGVYSGATVKIADSVNYGAVTSVDRAGGVIGCADSGGSTLIKLVVSNSFNYAAVTADGVAGGVVGRLFGSNGSQLYNNGNVGAVSCAAGVAGGAIGSLNFYGKSGVTPVDGLMQKGTVSTVSGCASIGVGAFDSITTTGNTISFGSAILAVAATATGGGQVGSLCGGYIGADSTQSVAVSADDNCRLLGDYPVSYYDNAGQPQMLAVTAMTAAELSSKTGAVVILNANATSKGHAQWVCVNGYPELGIFADTPPKVGMMLLFF